MAQIQAAVPDHLRQKNTLKSLTFVARDIFFSSLLYLFSQCIEPCSLLLAQWLPQSSVTHQTVWSLLWGFYWFWQSIVFAGFFCLAHEAGHAALSPYGWANNIIGYTLHTVCILYANSINVECSLSSFLLHTMLGGQLTLVIIRLRGPSKETKSIFHILVFTLDSLRRS